jgi:hypothetical protein
MLGNVPGPIINWMRGTPRVLSAARVAGAAASA